jgi:hypothetical protein
MPLRRLPWLAKATGDAYGFFLYGKTQNIPPSPLEILAPGSARSNSAAPATVTLVALMSIS